MAIVYAVKTGNWTDATVWNTGVLPTTADDVYSNTFTVTINTSPTVLSIRNTAGGAAVAGGGFVATNGITITCTGSGIIAGAVNCLSSGVNNSYTLISNVSSTGAGSGANHNSTGTLNVVGNCQNTGNGSAILNFTTGIVNLTGSAISNSTSLSSTIANNVAGTINIVGNCTGGAGATARAASNSSTGVINITGLCTGGAVAFTEAINCGNGSAVIVGEVQASFFSAAVTGTPSGFAILTGPLVASAGTGAGAASSGINPCTCGRWFPADTALGTFEYRVRGATVSGPASERPLRQLFLTDAYAAGYPAPANVRNTTTYGPGNIYLGTCAIPPAGSVSLGVPVDATVGTAPLTAGAIRAALGLASANLDAQLDALPTAAEIWSAPARTITGGIVDTLTNAPDVPTEQEIADAVRLELTPELTRVANCATVETTGDQIASLL